MAFFPLIRKTTASFRSARTREGSWLLSLSLNNAVDQPGCLCIAQSQQLPDIHIHHLIQLAGIHPEKVEATILANPSTSPFLQQALLDLKMLPPDQAARKSFLLARLAQSKLTQRPRA